MPGMAEKVDYGTLGAGTRIRAWASGPPESWKYREIAVGTTDNNRWYAARTGQTWTAAWLCQDEREACDLADRWMRGGQWRTTPARFGPDGKPADGGTWWKSGGQWLPGDRPGDT